MKTELKNNWSTYCDTDKLTDDVMALLGKYNHRHTEYGVTAVLDEFFKNKKDLIELFRTHPNYAGDLRIVFNGEFERENSRNEISSFISDFKDKLDAKTLIMRKTDENGKTMEDYIRSGPKFYYAKDLLDPEKYAEMEKNMSFMTKFTADGYLVEDEEKYKKFSRAVSLFGNIAKNTIDSEEAENINAELPEKTKKNSVASGMKTSRAMNRVCEAFGVTKAKEYNKLFAEYADMVSGKTRTLKVVLSCNPYDYLTMSFGVNWASCHTIDKTNKRHIGDGSNGYHGMYCGGTVSYMLDGTSFVMYVVKPDDDVQTAGKIYRNMFHWNGHDLLQGRIYPQGNDGATDLYKKFRIMVQDKFTEMLGLNSITWLHNSNIGNLNIDSRGAHYRDYLNFSSCSYSYPSEYGSDNKKEFVIGHNGICMYCGKENGAADNLSHGVCEIPEIIEASKADAAFAYETADDGVSAAEYPEA